MRLKLTTFSMRRRWRASSLRDLDCRRDIRDWTRSHANFFRAVQIEKRVMFIILTLIIAVAAFNSYRTW